jgi:hypothetical protein
MICGGFLSAEDRRHLIALARDGSAASRLTRRANALVLVDDGWSCQEKRAIGNGCAGAHERHAELKEWIGSDFDPDNVDIKELAAHDVMLASSGRGPRPHDALAARSHAGYGKLLAALRSRPQSSMTNSGPWAYAYAGAISGEGDALATIKATAP